MLSLLFGFCLLVQVAPGEEIIGPFAKKSLGLDLATVPFGQAVQANDGYAPEGSPLQLFLSTTNDVSFSWMTNPLSAQYRKNFLNRTLRFGFHNGRLAVVRISTSALESNGAAIESESQRRKELFQLQEELLKASPTHKSNFEDGAFRIRYAVSCGPDEHSVFVQEFEISPVEKKENL